VPGMCTVSVIGNFVDIVFCVVYGVTYLGVPFPRYNVCMYYYVENVFLGFYDIFPQAK
jgi:hypothetical protein